MMHSALHRLLVCCLAFGGALMLTGRAAADQHLTFRGVVCDKEGNPIPHARVYFGGTDRKAATLTDHKGQFISQELLVWGAIIIAVMADGYGPAALKYGPPFFSDQDSAKLKFTLRPSATRDGEVRDAAGKPVAGIKITPQYDIENVFYYGRTVVSDAMGRFQIRDLPSPPKRPTEIFDSFPIGVRLIKVQLVVTGTGIAHADDVPVPPEGFLEIKVQKPQPAVALAR